jgi:hypothetical protein
MDLNYEIDRLSRLFRGIAAHIETVAAEYAKSRSKLGKALEDGLSKQGFDRSWLRCLEDIGNGIAMPDIIWLDPAKREAVRVAAVDRQAELLKSGVAGKPLALAPLDSIRRAVAGSPPRQSRAVPVRPHIRRTPAPASAPVVDGIRLRGTRFTWAEVCNALERASIPADIAARIREICERPVQAQAC